MEPQEKSYTIHPQFYEQALDILERENIPYETKSKMEYDLICIHTITITQDFQDKQLDVLIRFLHESSLIIINNQRQRIEHFIKIDRDYKRIENDMKALIFHVCLSDESSKSKEKNRHLAQLLRSDLAKQLIPISKRRSP